MRMLEGQVALVTGSSRGIGAAIATEFARRGAAVAVHGRDQAAISNVVAAIRGVGGTAIGVAGDVTNSAHLDAMRCQIEEGAGPVDILIANAGGSPLTLGVPLEKIPEEEWRATVDGNLLATFLTLKCFLPGMKERGRGSIITVASSAARRTNALAPIAYSVAKAAIALLTQNVATDVGPFGIRANCIAPDVILTERKLALIPPSYQATMADQLPLKRLGTPQDVADAAAFLASDDASWITGLILDVTGGAAMI